MATHTTAKTKAAAASTSPAGKKQKEKKPALSSYVLRVKENDVLLGRGAIVLRNEGNVRFRELINQNRAEYMSTGKHAVKDVVSRRILKTIRERGGRFLQKIDNEDGRLLLGITKKVKEAWIIVDQEISLLKIKQALREQESPKGKPKKSTSTPQRKRKRTGERETNNSRSPGTNSKPINDQSSSSSSSSCSSTSSSYFSDAKQSGAERETKQRSVSTTFQDDGNNWEIPGRAVKSERIASAMSDDGQVNEKVRAAYKDERNQNNKCFQAGEDNNEMSSRSSSSSKIDESRLDLNFRLKHPSLRKRDLSRLRRQQEHTIHHAEQQQEQQHDKLSIN